MGTGNLPTEILYHPAFPLVAEILIKSTLLVLCTLVLTHLLRNRAASIRHAVWSISFFALIALPVFVLFGPAMHVPVNVQIVPERTAEATPARQAFVYSPIPEHDPVVVKRRHSVAAPAVTEDALAVPFSPAAPPARAGAAGADAAARPFSLETALGLAWLAGFLFVLFKSAMGFTAVYWLARRARPVSDPRLLARLDGYRMGLGINRPVRLVKSMYAIMPMTWGAIRPVIMLPADVNEWTGDRLRVVLMHELAHVKRFDWLIQTVAQLATALYWFNPLIWRAESELRRERELACDEAVLDSGARASDYADHLLDIARKGTTPRYAPNAALAMARHSQLEQRVRAILNPERPCASRVLNAAIVLAGTLVALPLLAMRPAPAEIPEAAPAPMVAHQAQPPVVPSLPLRESKPFAHSSNDDSFMWRGHVATGGTIEIKGVNGPISARRAEGTETVVRAAKSARSDNPASVQIVAVEHDGGVTICALYPGEQNECRPGDEGRIEADDNDVTVSFSVEVPAGVRFSASTLNGAISATNLASQINVRTVNGAVSASSAAGIAAKTVNGAVQVAVTGPEVSEAVNVQTVNGAIRLSLPDQANANVSAQTVNGRIRSEFESIPVTRERRGPQYSASGQIGRGGAPLLLQTVNGAIEITRGVNTSSGARHRLPEVGHSSVPLTPDPGQVEESVRAHVHPGSVYLAYASDADDDLRAEIISLASELRGIEAQIARTDTCTYDRQRCIEERRAKLEAEIEARAERLAARIEERMEELEPLIEEYSLAFAEELAIPTLELLERKLPALLERLEAEIPTLLDEVMESLSRALRDWDRDID